MVRCLFDRCIIGLENDRKCQYKIAKNKIFWKKIGKKFYKSFIDFTVPFDTINTKKDPFRKVGDPMDMIGSIADYSVMMSQNQLMTNVSTEVLSMTLDSFQGQASEVVKMMESSVQPYLGQNINTYV